MGNAIRNHYWDARLFIVTEVLLLDLSADRENVGSQSSEELPRCNLKPDTEETGLSRVVGGSFNQQKELTGEACLGCQQDDWIPIASLQIIEVSK